MLADLLSSTQLRIGVLTFACAWILGLALRIDHSRGMSPLIDPVTMPAYRQIKLIGSLRWLFGYKPVDGYVSVIGFVLQLPALLSLIASIVLSLFSLTSGYFLLGPILVLFVSMPMALHLADRLWHKQRNE